MQCVQPIKGQIIDRMNLYRQICGVGTEHAHQKVMNDGIQPESFVDLVSVGLSQWFQHMIYMDWFIHLGHEVPKSPS